MDSLFSIAECWRSLRISGSVTAAITELLRTAKCIYLFGGVIEVIGNSGIARWGNAGAYQGVPGGRGGKWRVSKRKGLKAVSTLIYCPLSPPLHLFPTFLSLFRFSFLYFKRKHAPKMIWFFLLHKTLKNHFHTTIPDISSFSSE